MNTDTTPRLFVSTIRAASIRTDALVSLLGGSNGVARWHTGRAPWTDLWRGNPSVAEAGRRAHQARLQPGVVEQLVGHETCDASAASASDLAASAVFHLDCALEGPVVKTGFPGSEECAYRVWGVEFVSVGQQTAASQRSSAVEGWVVVHAVLEAPEAVTDADWLKARRRELDVFNIRQPASGLSQTDSDGVSDDLDYLGDVAAQVLQPAGFELARDEEQQINYVCAMARVSVTKEQARDNAAVAPALMPEVSGLRLGAQQTFPAHVLRTTDGTPGLSFSYRSYALASQRLVFTIADDDTHGIVNYFVDVYPAFLLCAIQDSRLNDLSMPLLRGELFRADPEAGGRMVISDEALEMQREYYAFKSQYWWARWGRRGTGVLLVPAIQKYWHLEELVQQLDAEFRDYGAMAQAEEAQTRLREQGKWRRLATTASIVVGGMSVLGSWAELSGLGILDGDGNGITNALAVVLSVLAGLFLVSVEIDRRRGRDGGSAAARYGWVRGLLLVAIVAPLATFLSDGTGLMIAGYLVGGVALIAAIWLWITTTRANSAA